LKRSVNYTIFFFILIALIISSITAYYFLTDPKKNINTQQQIDNLQFQVIELELQNLKKHFELLETYNFNTVLAKLQLAKEYEQKIQKIFLDSLNSNSFYAKYKPYNECVNLLYNTSKYETINLKNNISEITQYVRKLENNYIEKNIIDCKKEIEKIQSLILDAKQRTKIICANFDSLYHDINSYIK